VIIKNAEETCEWRPSFYDFNVTGRHLVLLLLRCNVNQLPKTVVPSLERGDLSPLSCAAAWRCAFLERPVFENLLRQSRRPKAPTVGALQIGEAGNQSHDLDCATMPKS